jgi:pantoate--beta-alanine ligase
VMEVFETPAAWRARRAKARAARTLGFVPTMGALHEGHLSLVRRSRLENDLTLVSIFVNPTQFDEGADLARYPRMLEADLASLRTEGVDYVLVPSERDLYRDGYRYRVRETGLSARFEGAHRPGHFEGVLTVVFKLLQIAGAHRAYFGQKDWQQLELVRGLADAFFLPTAIVGCPTIRDPDGLALSSRNSRLSVDDRARAPTFYRALSTARTAEDAVRQLAATGFAVDYVADVADATRNGGARRLGAVRLGGVRLIDNAPIGPIGSGESGGSGGSRGSGGSGGSGESGVSGGCGIRGGCDDSGARRRQQRDLRRGV